MHRLLQRQIKRFLGDVAALPPEFAAFLAAVDEAYHSADADRLMIERALELMSKELTEANAGLRKELAEHQHTELELKKEKEEQIFLFKKLEVVQNQLMQSDKLASIGQLAAGVAHEINNPIGYVYSNLGTLEKYVRDVFSLLDSYEQAESVITDAEVRVRLQALKEQFDIDFMKKDIDALMDESRDGITRVRTIVQSLKDFAHADTADEWQYADLRRGLDSTLNIVNNEIKYKADVIRNYGNIPDVECLPSQLNQVFMNLLLNAVQAIEQHGTITLRTGQQDDAVWVEISDTGKGIAPEYRQKIFDPFFTTKPIGKGTGLGLSLSYGIIQKHHGRIEVESEVGKGTSFRIWLPIKHIVQEQ